MAKKLKKSVAIIGDSFIDRYCFGEVSRLSPEAPVPILDAKRWEDRGGGAINVANNLFSMGIAPTLFTITSMKLPYRVVTPINCTSLMKTRFITNNYQLLRLDEPKVYSKDDLKNMVYPDPDEWDIIAIVDYNKGIIQEGQMLNHRATIVDSKKNNYLIFSGTQIIKVNEKEWMSSKTHEVFPQAFVTKGREGIDYYESGKWVCNESTETQDVIDVTGAGDTVMASIIYSLCKNIKDPKKIMKLANKAAGKVIKRFGTSVAGKV